MERSIVLASQEALGGGLVQFQVQLLDECGGGRVAVVVVGIVRWSDPQRVLESDGRILHVGPRGRTSVVTVPTGARRQEFDLPIQVQRFRRVRHRRRLERCRRSKRHGRLQADVSQGECTSDFATCKRPIGTGTAPLNPHRWCNKVRTVVEGTSEGDADGIGVGGLDGTPVGAPEGRKLGATDSDGATLGAGDVVGAALTDGA